jgi:hypothetical protein
LGRAGWPAISSPHEQHRHFHNWVYQYYEQFMAVLDDGERLVGEWLMQAHSTRYELRHDPFVAFDLMIGDERRPYDEFIARLAGRFVTPTLLHRGGAFSIEAAMQHLNIYGFHVALDPVEGAVWRVERDNPTGKKGEKKRIVSLWLPWMPTRDIPTMVWILFGFSISSTLYDFGWGAATQADSIAH